MRKCNAGVLVALHDLNLAMRYADEVVMIKDSRVYAQGAPQDVITTESIRAVYDVESEVVEGNGGLYIHIREDPEDIERIESEPLSTTP